MAPDQSGKIWIKPLGNLTKIQTEESFKNNNEIKNEDDKNDDKNDDRVFFHLIIQMFFHLIIQMFLLYSS